jgi:periplasmic protein TonB
VLSAVKSPAPMPYDITMEQADLKPPRRVRLGVGLAVVVMHLVVIAALVRAFAPNLPAAMAESLGQALTVTVTTPEPRPEPSPEPTREAVAPKPQGMVAPEGRKATPREVAAPRPEIVIATKAAPPVAGNGAQDSAGAGDTGSGTGAGGEGQGTGSGSAGNGTGGGGAAKATKIAGEINSARDYPRATRDLRLGDHVIVALTVGKDGRVSQCRVHRASRDPEADRITCKLATKRFRFRPATDAAGNPVESVFGWQQRWFYNGRD